MISRSSSRRRVDRREQRRPRLAGEDRRLGRWGRIARPAILGGAEGETGPAPGRPPSVAGLVGDDPQEPRPERGVGPEPRQRGVGLDERVLDGVLGVAVGRDEMRRPDGDVLVASDQLLVGHDLAIPRAVDQLGIFQWTALHFSDGPPRSTVALTPACGRRGSRAPRNSKRRRRCRRRALRRDEAAERLLEAVKLLAEVRGQCPSTSLRSSWTHLPAIVALSVFQLYW